MRKQLAAAGLTAGLAVGAVGGFALASTTASVGAQNGTSTTTVSAPTRGDHPDRGAHLDAALKPLVDDGTITQAQADKVKDALLAARPDGGGGDHRGGFGRGRGPGLDAAATALGLSVDELRTELEKGSSIAEIATSKGVDLSKVVDALVSEAAKRLAEQVTAGRITQTQADEKAAEVKERITAMVNGELPGGGPGFGEHGPGGHGPGGHGPGGHGPGGHGPDDGDAPDDGSGAPGAPGPNGSAPTTTAG